MYPFPMADMHEPDCRFNGRSLQRSGSNTGRCLLSQRESTLLWTFWCVVKVGYSHISVGLVGNE